jgi:hypothetical protein
MLKTLKRRNLPTFQFTERTLFERICFHGGVVADVYQCRSFLPKSTLEMSPGARWCRHMLHGGRGHTLFCNLTCREKHSCSSGAEAYTVQTNSAMQVE